MLSLERLVGAGGVVVNLRMHYTGFRVSRLVIGELVVAKKSVPVHDLSIISLQWKQTAHRGLCCWFAHLLARSANG